MAKPKLIENHSDLPNDTVSPMAHSVVLQTSTSKYISEGVERAAPLLNSVKTYDTFMNQLGFPSPTDTAQANTLRGDVKNELGRLAKQLNLDYPGQEVPLRSSGLPLANSNTAARPDGDGQFDPKITLSDGSTPGCLRIDFEGFVGCVQKITRYTTDPTLDPKHWEVALGGGRSREIGSFPKGTEVWVMSAPLMGSTTDPVYSPVVSRIVQ